MCLEEGGRSAVGGGNRANVNIYFKSSAERKERAGVATEMGKEVLGIFYVKRNITAYLNIDRILLLKIHPPDILPPRGSRHMYEDSHY